MSAEALDKYQRRPKHKVALIFSYVGTKYSGLQIQINAPNTVEAALWSSVCKADLVHPLSAVSLNKVSWQRCGRTDKGVHALRQVVSAKLMVDDDQEAVEAINKTLPADIRVLSIQRVVNSFNAKGSCMARQYSYFAPTYLYPNFDGPRLQALLVKMTGTRNFHNFTVKKDPRDPSAKRHIRTIVVTPVSVVSGQECVEVILYGDSFMLHQIRKMIGFVVAVMAGYLPEWFFDVIFSPHFKFDVMMVPGHCLMLDTPIFDGYNKTRGAAHGTLDFRPVEMAAEAFRRDMVHPEIIRLEREGQLVSKWMSHLKERFAPRYQYAAQLIEEAMKEGACRADQVGSDKLGEISVKVRAYADAMIKEWKSKGADLQVEEEEEEGAADAEGADAE
jgi:tRNA pseudouridine38-40 synthase